MMGWFKPRVLPDFLRVPWTIRDVVVFVLAWFGIQVAVVAGLGLSQSWFGPAKLFLEAVGRNDIGALFALSLLDAVVGLGIIGLYVRKYGVDWGAVGWRRVGLGRAVLWVGGVLVTFIVAANLLLWVVSVLSTHFDANQPQQNEFLGASGGHRSLAWVALVVLPPIVEETIFRGFLFPALARRTGLVWGAVISSGLFALAHGQANIAVYTFPLGLLLCLMYRRLGSIVPGMALHMVNNYLAYMAVTGSK